MTYHGKAWQAAREATIHAIEHGTVYVGREFSRLTEHMIEEAGGHCVVERLEGPANMNRIEVVSTRQPCAIEGCGNTTQVTPGAPATKLCVPCFAERFEPR